MRGRLRVWIAPTVPPRGTRRCPGAASGPGLRGPIVCVRAPGPRRHFLHTGTSFLRECAACRSAARARLPGDLLGGPPLRVVRLKPVAGHPQYLAQRQVEQNGSYRCELDGRPGHDLAAVSAEYDTSASSVVEIKSVPGSSPTRPASRPRIPRSAHVNPKSQHSPQKLAVNLMDVYTS
jgi:hypothetical protein